MRKVKPAVGAWAVCSHPDAVYPYLEALPISKLSADQNPMVAWGGQEIVVIHLFCVSAEDGPIVKAEIDRLRSKHEQAMAQMTKILADQRRRSVLGQLDPRS